MKASLKALVAVSALIAPEMAHAQQTLRVIDTAPNDVLNVREYPTAEARIVGVIPPNGRGIVPTGEVNGNWIFVRYRKVEGWVSRRFVYPEAPPVRRGRALDEDE
ncbi:SH3 type 3 domain protein [Methylobacterium sp. 4-46]|uniref:SH3 domain-containing protein n=1 Tax=unclassified Methylobacterium TaxID=2615210 RepID=UPI000152D76A|nr:MULTISPECIES: SH3 domain-containing protein [Methylobacterium]ACA17750.1 SH3 type 3 domain protein [Methylobacterium sp. 4-46]WFT83418.1 SH3 domain-containing protein [Methylobacterium nodulans]